MSLLDENEGFRNKKAVEVTAPPKQIQQPRFSNPGSVTQVRAYVTFFKVLVTSATVLFATSPTAYSRLTDCASRSMNV